MNSDACSHVVECDASDLLGLTEACVKTDARVRIEFDHHYMTSVPGVYAVGDVTDRPMRAHKAEDDGVACVELLSSKTGDVH